MDVWQKDTNFPPQILQDMGQDKENNNSPRPKTDEKAVRRPSVSRYER